MTVKKVGFIGCGTMGGNMAINLLNSGFDLTVFDINREVLDPLVEQGARAATSPAGAAYDAEVVIMMLHNPDVEIVMNGENGVVPGLKPGAILIDSGNSDPRLSPGRFEHCKKKGIHFLDIGVSGGPAGARSATLAIMVGGAREAFERALPLFDAIGSSVSYMGGPGAGHLSKLVGILISQGTIALVGEALSFAHREGLNMPELVNALSTSTAGSAIMNKAVKLHHEPLPEDWRQNLQEINRARAGSDAEPWALAMAGEISHPLPIVGLVNELTKMYRADSAQPNAEMTDKIFYQLVAMA